MDCQDQLSRRGGVRRKRLDANGTIHYLGTYERNVGNGLETTEVVTKYYHALGRLVAFRKGGVLYWVGTDHLGSTIRVADSSFNAVDGMRYRPYGESRDAGTNLKTDHKFTSQIEDASVGLHWYGSRDYDPYLNRFVSADTIVPEAGNPQALNRYSYGFNSPVKYVDPSGHDPVDWINEDWQQEFYDAHGRAPTDIDVVYRIASMAIASGYSDAGAVLDYVAGAVETGESGGAVNPAPRVQLSDPDLVRGPAYDNTRALKWGPAPQRTGTLGLGGQLSGAALGWSGQAQVLAVTAPDGFGLAFTLGAGGGAATPGAAAFTVGAQVTNAQRLEQLAGYGGAAGGGAGDGVFISTDTVVTNGVVGQELFVGLGVGAEVHGVGARTWVWKIW